MTWMTNGESPSRAWRDFMDLMNDHDEGLDTPVGLRPHANPDATLMTHKYRASIVVLSISKSVEPNKEQKALINIFQQGNNCKH